MATTAALAVAMRIVYVTAPSQEVARNLSLSIVKNHLAACVNIVDGVKSIYEWEGKIEESDEKLLIIKTTQAKLETLKAEVHKLHPYDVPEFVVLPVTDASEKYAEWVTNQTK